MQAPVSSMSSMTLHMMYSSLYATTFADLAML